MLSCSWAVDGISGDCLFGPLGVTWNTILRVPGRQHRVVGNARTMVARLRLLDRRPALVLGWVNLLEHSTKTMSRRQYGCGIGRMPHTLTETSGQLGTATVGKDLPVRIPTSSGCPDRLAPEGLVWLRRKVAHYASVPKKHSENMWLDKSEAFSKRYRVPRMSYT